LKEGNFLVGWREWAALPLLGIPLIKAKVDTGARSSSLHAHVERLFNEDGTPMIEFVVHPDWPDMKPEVRTVAPLFDERNVRSSNGTVEQRPFITTDIVMGGHRWALEFNLTSRDTMGFQLLLGRQAFRRRAIVDPSRSFMLGKPDEGKPKG